jgi:hypothetical protein
LGRIPGIALAVMERPWCEPGPLSFWGDGGIQVGQVHDCAPVPEEPHKGADILLGICVIPEHLLRRSVAEVDFFARNAPGASAHSSERALIQRVKPTLPFSSAPARDLSLRGMWLAPL